MFQNMLAPTLPQYCAITNLISHGIYKDHSSCAMQISSRKKACIAIQTPLAAPLANFPIYDVVLRLIFTPPALRCPHGDISNTALLNGTYHDSPNSTNLSRFIHVCRCNYTLECCDSLCKNMHPLSPLLRASRPHSLESKIKSKCMQDPQITSPHPLYLYNFLRHSDLGVFHSPLWETSGSDTTIAAESILISTRGGSFYALIGN